MLRSLTAARAGQNKAGCVATLLTSCHTPWTGACAASGPAQQAQRTSVVMFFLGSGRDMASTAGLPGLRRKRVISCVGGWRQGRRIVRHQTEASMVVAVRALDADLQPSLGSHKTDAPPHSRTVLSANGSSHSAVWGLTLQMGGPLTGSSTRSFSGGRLLTSPPPPPLLPPPRGDCCPELAAAAAGMLGVAGPAAPPPAAGEAGAPSLVSALSAAPGRGEDVPDSPPLGAAPAASGDSGCGRSSMSCWDGCGG